MAQAKVLTERDLEKLLATIRRSRHARRDRLAVLLTFWSGMRVGEVSSLRVRDLLNQDRSVKSEIRLSSEQTKGHHGRVVLLPEKLKDEIETYFRGVEVGSFDELIFRSQIRGRAFTAEGLAHRLKDIYGRAGLENASSHSGRRTFITNLANQGINARVLQELAGHKHLSTTQRYIDINDTILRRAVEMI